MVQNVFSCRTPMDCLAQPLGCAHPAFETTDLEDGLKLKAKKQDKNKIYSLASMYSVQEVKDFQNLVQDYGRNSLRSWRVSQTS